VTVALVPPAREHLRAVEALFDDPDVLRFTRLPEPPPPDFAETWLGLYERGRRDGTREGFAVVDEGEFLGLALAPRIEREARTAELGYIVAPAARPRGHELWSRLPTD
jgi:RimJ/RimL family protein N-acetyltransferase